jgi:hypothetical protein
MRIITIIAIAASMLAGCAGGIKYSLRVIDSTDELLVIRATGKTEYDALNSAVGKATEMLGTYIEQKPPDCNYNPGQGQQRVAGTGSYVDLGSWHECVIYAQKNLETP